MTKDASLSPKEIKQKLRNYLLFAIVSLLATALGVWLGFSYYAVAGPRFYIGFLLFIFGLPAFGYFLVYKYAGLLGKEQDETDDDNN